MKKIFVSKSVDLMKEWDLKKNTEEGIFANEITVGSSKKAWWMCPKEHSYKAAINKRNERGCPYCSNRKILSGYNDLKTLFPDVVDEWHPSLNENLKPEQLFPKSSKKVWWQCRRCGCEWKAYVYSRTGQRTNCPNCSGNKTSFPEQAVMFFVKKYFEDAISRDKSLGFELDVYIPSLMVGIEYDGRNFHNQKKDEIKDSKCKRKGITLYRIRENGLAATKYAKNFFREDFRDASLEKAIKDILSEIGVKEILDVSIEKYRMEIMSQYYEAETEKSIAAIYPELIDEWHPTKNGNLMPDRCKYRSGRKVWWKCKKCGGEYRAIVAQRTKGHGCPFCSGIKALEGETDLETNYPELAKEWHPTKNREILPSMVKPQSNLKVWWKCKKCDNEWDAYIYSRVNGNGCPYCAGQRLIVGQNDLATINPILAKEWHSIKNGELSPHDVMASSGKKVWWFCPHCQNEWQATIASRNRGNGCIVCGVIKSASAKMKPVVQLTEDNSIVARYASIKEAKAATGAQCIGDCCRNKRKTSGGYVWRFEYSEYEKRTSLEL